MSLKHASLFSGIGGFDLAAQNVGWENVLHCEINPFCQTVLKYYWPNAKTYTDIKQTDFTKHMGTIDVLSGGFPCQPYSSAGKRLGKDDDRHLWPQMLRAIREIKPTWVVGENVRGLLNWNGGLVFREVQSDLEAEGYEVIPFLLPACAVGAPHERYRLWFVAYSERLGQQRQGQHKFTLHSQTKRARKTEWVKHLFRGESVPHLYEHLNGLPRRLDNIAVLEWVESSAQGYGNAVVPYLVEQIFKAINQTTQA